MKVTVTLNDRGAIALPVKLRQALGLKPYDRLFAETTPEGLLLRRAVTLPIDIYAPEREREFDTAEAELARFVRRKAPSTKRTSRSARNAHR